MDILGGHLLHDQATRQLFAGPYLQDEDTKTPSKERGGPFDPNSFSDDLAPPKMPPTKPTPRGIERPDVPLLGAPQSLQIRPQPPIPGLEVPGAAVPGENGRPPMAPPMMPGMMPPPRNNAPAGPGLKGPPKMPSVKAPKPVSHSPATKPPHQQSAPSGTPYKSPLKPDKSPSRPSGLGSPHKPPSGISAPPRAASSRLSNFDYLNTSSDEDQSGAMPSAPPMMPSAAPMGPSAAPPMPPTPAPMQQQGLPSVGDMEPDWGHGSGSGTHVSDEGPNWGSHPMMDGADFNTAHQADGGPDWGSHPQMSDPDWSSARRKGMMFRRLRIRR
jgi:hypothetical protein